MLEQRIARLNKEEEEEQQGGGFHQIKGNREKCRKWMDDDSRTETCE